MKKMNYSVKGSYLPAFVAGRRRAGPGTIAPSVNVVPLHTITLTKQPIDCTASPHRPTRAIENMEV